MFLQVSSAGSFENRAFVQDNGSFFGSEGYGHAQEHQMQHAAFANVEGIPRYPMAIKGTFFCQLKTDWSTELSFRRTTKL